MLDQMSFKEAMSSFVSGVTIVTMKARGGAYHGLTVSAFSSVSLDPPLVLFCRKCQKLEAEDLGIGDIAVINILSQDQRELAFRFANPRIDNEARFEQVPFDLYQAVPVLKGTQCSIAAKVNACHRAGDHWVHICEVLEVWPASGKSPLVYYDREFHDLPEKASV